MGTTHSSYTSVATSSPQNRRHGEDLLHYATNVQFKQILHLINRQPAPWTYEADNVGERDAHIVKRQLVSMLEERGYKVNVEMLYYCKIVELDAYGLPKTSPVYDWRCVVGKRYRLEEERANVRTVLTIKK